MISEFCTQRVLLLNRDHQIQAIKIVLYCGIKKCKKNIKFKIRFDFTSKNEFCQTIKRLAVNAYNLGDAGMVKEIIKILNGVEEREFA